MESNDRLKLAQELELAFSDCPLAMFRSIAKALRANDLQSARQFFLNDRDKLGFQDRTWEIKLSAFFKTKP